MQLQHYPHIYDPSIRLSSILVLITYSLPIIYRIDTIIFMNIKDKSEYEVLYR